MKTLLNPLIKVLSLTVAIFTAPAFAGSPATTGALATKANRIVGLWTVNGSVSGANCSPASSGPAMNIRTYLLFHAGGTLTELPRLPSSNAPAPRTFGVGTWHYEAPTNTYFVSFQFDWFAGGAYQGYATVDREIRLSADANSMAGPAVSVRYLDNGQEVFAQCGTGIGTRL